MLEKARQAIWPSYAPLSFLMFWAPMANARSCLIRTAFTREALKFDGITYHGTYESIVSGELWERVQMRGLQRASKISISAGFLSPPDATAITKSTSSSLSNVGSQLFISRNMARIVLWSNSPPNVACGLDDETALTARLQRRR